MINEENKSKLAKGVDVVDSKGREIKIKKPGFLAPLRLVEALGRSAENDRYYRMLEPVLWVAEIDGLPFSLGTSKREVEASYERLGEEGIEAFNTVLLDLLGDDPLPPENGDLPPKEEIDAIKKSLPTPNLESDAT